MEISGKEIKEGMEIVINPDEKIKNNVIVSRRDLFSEKKIRQERQQNYRKGSTGGDR